MELLAQNKVFEGWHKRYQHRSDTLNCEMNFAIFLPPQATTSTPVPVLYWLSGLTCTDENFMQKAAAFKAAAKHGIAIVAPDTSPRGDDVADAEDAAYDLGKGAGFYLDSVKEPWSRHYQMYSYIVSELPALIESHFPVSQKRSIAGHSMGGHGALTIGIKQPKRYDSISAFAPICHPSTVPWGIKAFTAYLGDDRSLWSEYDATLLLEERGCESPILVDQGREDNFLEEQLSSQAFIDAAKRKEVALTFNFHDGYDHSYFFIQSFIQEHIAFHARYLK